MKAIEIKLDTGTWYIPLEEWSHGTVLLAGNGGKHVLSPEDIRANWNAWVKDLVPNELLLTHEELERYYPDIFINYE